MPVDLVLAALIVFGAMVVRGFAGFGGALLMVPLLGLVWDIRLAIVAVAIIQTVSGLMLAVMSRKAIDRPTLVPVLIWSIVGLAAGSLLLASLPVEWIARILGVITIIIGIITLARRIVVVQEPGRSRGLLISGVGLTGGVLHGLIGTSGPVIVPYLQRVLPSPAGMRSTLLAYFLVLDGLRIGGYLQLGLVSADTLQRSALLVPVAILGSVIGSRMHVKVSGDVFRIAVAVLLILAGVLLLT
jgi:uncharacterized protein